MNIRKSFMALAAVAAMAGCAGTDIPTRLEPMNFDATNTIGVQTQIHNYDIRSVNVVVPDELQVSEANSYYPNADIVWRGEPFGDRHEQLRAMFQDAADSVAPMVHGSVPVNITLVLERFHGVTEKTRFSVGGYYSVHFIMTVTDAETGTVIEGPVRIEGSLAAPGGEAALELDRAGQTEKVRVSAYLRQLFYAEWAS